MSNRRAVVGVMGAGEGASAEAVAARCLLLRRARLPNRRRTLWPWPRSWGSASAPGVGCCSLVADRRG
jgi:hypothetical protein